MTHPIQQLELDSRGTLRFRRNCIVDFLLKESRHDLNDLASMNFRREDWVQFAQLHGYSLDGWATLSYVNEIDFAMAEAVRAGKSEREGLLFRIEELEVQIRDVITALGGEPGE